MQSAEDQELADSLAEYAQSEEVQKLLTDLARRVLARADIPRHEDFRLICELMQEAFSGGLRTGIRWSAEVYGDKLRKRAV